MTKRICQRLGWLACVLCAAWIFAGCAHNEPANRSPRPWTQKQGWEGGFPGGINEGR